MIMTGETRSFPRITCPGNTSSTTNPMFMALRLLHGILKTGSEGTDRIPLAHSNGGRLIYKYGETS